MAAQKPTKFIPYVSQQTEDLLMWRDPKKSGMIFGGSTIVFLFFRFVQIPLLALLLYAFGALVGGLTLWARFGKTLGRPMPEMESLREGVTEADYKTYADKLKPFIDRVTSTLHGVATAKNFGLNAQLTFGLFFGGKLLSYFHPLSLAYSVIFTSFVAPKVYEQEKERIDQGFVFLKDKMAELFKMMMKELEKLAEKVPALKNLLANMKGKKKE